MTELTEKELIRAIDFRATRLRYIPTEDWRGELRQRLYHINRGRSYLTFQGLGTGFHMHEGVFPRAYVPKSVSWHIYIFSGVNCVLLRPDEHIPDPPDPTICYWLAAARFGKDLTDRWIDSLPFKSRPRSPWRGTWGMEVIGQIPDKWTVADEFWKFYEQPEIQQRIEQYG